MAGMKLTNFDGKTVLITGATGGLGSLIAKRMASQGVRIALVARRAEELKKLADEIKEAGGESFVFPCDVSNLNQVKNTVENVLEKLGYVDILINSAGYVRHRPFLDWNIDEQEDIMRVNYLGSMYFSKLLLPQMVERKQGWIVYMASAGGKIAVPDETAFAASQFAIIGLAEALSLEVEDDGVHILTMLPGSFDTTFFTEEDMVRVPPVTKNNLLDPVIFVDAFFDALAKGKREVTCPKHIATGYIVRALAPSFMRKQVKKVTLDALILE